MSEELRAKFKELLDLGPTVLEQPVQNNSQAASSTMDMPLRGTSKITPPPQKRSQLVLFLILAGLICAIVLYCKYMYSQTVNNDSVKNIENDIDKLLEEEDDDGEELDTGTVPSNDAVVVQNNDPLFHPLTVM